MKRLYYLDLGTNSGALYVVDNQDGSYEIVLESSSGDDIKIINKELFDLLIKELS